MASRRQYLNFYLIAVFRVYECMPIIRLTNDLNGPIKFSDFKQQKNISSALDAPSVGR